MAATDTEIVARRDPSAGLDFARRASQMGLPVGPATHLAAERQRLAGLTWRHFTAKPMSATVGAELHGIDLTAELSDDAVAEIRQALLDYKVIFFRDQPLTPAQHVAFAKRFGDLEVHPFIPANGEHPELVHFEKGAEVGGYENSWHHDVTWRDAPSMGAILHALQVPAFGGDTLFCDMYAAYEGLDDETKERVEGLDAAHDFMRAFGRQVPPGREQEFRDRYPVQHHPVVITHPGTGRKLLYVNRNFTDHLVGLPRDESDALLMHLYRQADTPEYQVRFHWEKDSVAFWDNRAVQHYAASDYWPEVRIMERASIIGTRPSR
jgi:alpha-ketoglutarate-dependent taurine dioxygenase